MCIYEFYLCIFRNTWHCLWSTIVWGHQRFFQLLIRCLVTTVSIHNVYGDPYEVEQTMPNNVLWGPLHSNAIIIEHDERVTSGRGINGWTFYLSCTGHRLTAVSPVILFQLLILEGASTVAQSPSFEPPSFLPSLSHIHICNISWNLICNSLKYTLSDLLESGSKFGQWMTSLALVRKLATRLSHSHCHISMDCHIGIISLYWVGSLIS